MNQQAPGNASMNALVLAMARRQHGVVSRSQLLDAGVSRHGIDYRLSCGLLVPIHRGVYAAGPVIGRLGRQLAAVLAAGDASFVSHRSAAAVLEMLPPLASGALVAISTTRDVRIRDPGIRIYKRSRLDPDEVTTRNGLPITTPARTLLDLAAVTDGWELERALATALRNRLVERRSVASLIDRYPRCTGRGRLRALLAVEGDPPFTRSEAERRFLDLVRTSGLPEPETNVVVEGFEVDCLWRTERLVVEVDGREYHSGCYAFERDRHRDGALIAAGFRTMRVTWRQIAQQPRPLITRLSQALVR